MDIIEFIKSNRDYFEDFITRSTYHSNRIEGNTLSYVETYAILFNANQFQVRGEPREFFEAVNHKYALSYVLDHCNEPLNQEVIKHIGILINKNIDEIAGYRTVNVLIKGAEHIPPAPNQVPSLMMQFVYNYENTTFSSPFQRAAQAHLQFERIHPFTDGNGRTGRLLINYEMLRNNLPPIVIPSDRRTEYFKLLASLNTEGLSHFFEELSTLESERLQAFGFEDRPRMEEQFKRIQNSHQDEKQNEIDPPAADYTR